MFTEKMFMKYKGIYLDMKKHKNIIQNLIKKLIIKALMQKIIITAIIIYSRLMMKKINSNKKEIEKPFLKTVYLIIIIIKANKNIIYYFLIRK